MSAREGRRTDAFEFNQTRLRACAPRSLMTADAERLRAWLALVRAPGLGDAGIHHLMERQPDVARWFAGGLDGELLATLPEATRHYLRNPAWESVERDLEWLAQVGNHVLTCTDPGYPVLLREIPGAPTLLFVRGDPTILARLQLAMVGSRNPSAGGARTAHAFARHLAQTGLTITSGLALGIDAASHEGALAGGGPTVAVMGTGLDRVYPAANRELAHRIAEHGALVSEFPPGTPPRRDHFPRRNRIISGLSLGTLVVEAALQSGSLITARLAAEQGREVLAIPGSIHNPLARGCHRLIREGAKLVETAADILEELGAVAQVPLLDAADANEADTGQSAATLDPDYRQLLENMGFDPVSCDELGRSTGLTPDAVSSMLLILELEGFVESCPGGRYQRTEKRS